MNKLTHFSEAGRARMVDVANKPETQRLAIASGILRMQPATLARIRSGSIAKGEVLTVADVGAVMAAKHTADIIPMCHTLALAGVEVVFSDMEADASGCAGIKVVTTTRCVGQTGVEMEALCAARVTLLTLYDRRNASDRRQRHENIQHRENRRRQGGRRGGGRAGGSSGA